MNKMNKEIKIGVAVVGVLGLVFAGLLVRKLAPRSDAAEQDQQVASAAPADSSAIDHKAIVVQPQGEPGQLAGAWNPRSDDGVPGEEPNDATPGFRYQASQDPPDRLAARDRYAPADESRGDENTAAVASGNPFQRGRAATAESTADPVDEPAGATRRASVEIPLDSATDGPALRSEMNLNTDPAADFPARDRPLEEPSFEPAAELAAEPSATRSRDEDQAEATFDRGDSPAPDSTVENPAQIAAPREFGNDQRRTTPPPAQVSVVNGKYTVQPNDNVWTISEKVYGTGGYFKALREHNRARLPNSDQLSPGTVIAVPPVTLLEQNYPALCPKQRKSVMVRPRAVQASARGRVASRANSYIVEEGDTLFDIARYELGKASRWAEIYELNRETLGEDFNFLQPGTELRMPSKQSADSFTRGRDPSYQR